MIALVDFHQAVVGKLHPGAVFGKLCADWAVNEKAWFIARVHTEHSCYCNDKDKYCTKKINDQVAKELMDAKIYLLQSSFLFDK